MSADRPVPQTLAGWPAWCLYEPRIPVLNPQQRAVDAIEAEMRLLPKRGPRGALRGRPRSRPNDPLDKMIDVAILGTVT